MNERTNLIYKAKSDAHGWLERKLMPSGMLTSTLSEQSFWGDGHKLPERGDRLDVYDNKDNSSHSTHWSPGDWVVSRVVYYPRPSDDEPAVAICYCDYSPIERDWKPLNVIPPSPEVVASIEAENPGWTAEHGEKFGLAAEKPENTHEEQEKPEK
jgi:hypothetical protein